MTESKFIELLHAQEGRLFRVAMTMLGNESDALDALQQTAEQAWKKRHSLRGGDAVFPAWIKKILVNRCLNILRARKRSIPTDPFAILDLEPPQERTDNYEIDLVWDFLITLPLEQKRILVLRYLADLSLKEIARELKIPLGTVKSRLNNAHSQLKKKLQTSE
ncbi:MAG: RNA polymerase sigma factor [Chitinophagales bacterium]